jgi:uncharacterized protein YutE (UPF0331/DUF86 family)
VSYLDDRIAELRRHLDHLRAIQGRVRSADDLRRDLSLDNDVRHSLLVACQRVIDVAGELSSRRRLRFEDFSEAIRNLAIYEELTDPLIRKLEPLPELRNGLVYGNGAGDAARVVDALRHLDGIERFVLALEKLGHKRR